MATTDIYERLANHLDQGIVASPKSPSLMPTPELSDFLAARFKGA